MSKAIDKSGQKFGRLTVIKLLYRNSHGDPVWLCQCECGTEKAILGPNLSNTKSCGCLRREQLRTHGLRYTPIYNTWSNMLARCNKSTHKDYKHYGGRGIGVCSRWHKFENFFTDMNPRPKGMTLERKDNSGDYCPENCVWATRADQSKNKRSNVWLTAFGKTQILADWIKELKITRKSIKQYLAEGRSLEWIIQYFDNHRQAVLTADQVREIRANVTATVAMLAVKYGVSLSNIRMIKKRMTWKGIL